jgi:predicted nucleic acid-binding Zn ribbon protein
MNFNLKKKRSGKTEPFTDLIRSYAQRYGWDELFAIELIKDEWENIVGTLLASHSIPVKISESSLIVNTDHPVYSNELSLMSVDVIEKINLKMGAVLINTLKIEHKGKMPRKQGKISPVR